LIASQVNCSPDPWIKKPEDDRTEEAEAGEQEVHREIQHGRWLKRVMKT
jgi:hypothetical protein